METHPAETNRQVIHKGWHIMPVVSIDEYTIKMIHHGTFGANSIWELSIPEFIWIHRNLDGGKDLAWIEPPPNIFPSDKSQDEPTETDQAPEP
jgi:hypothetical protein